jgi:hypothetical protein
MRHAARTQKAGTGFTLTREAVRDSATSFALLTLLRMTLLPRLLSYLGDVILASLGQTPIAMAQVVAL